MNGMTIEFVLEHYPVEETLQRMYMNGEKISCLRVLIQALGGNGEMLKLINNQDFELLHDYIDRRAGELIENGRESEL